MDSTTRFTVEPISSRPQKPCRAHKRHPVIDGEPLQLRLYPRWAKGPPPAGRWAIEQPQSAPLHQQDHDQTHDEDNHHQPRQQRLILFDSVVRLRWVPTTTTATSDEAQSSTTATAARPGQYLTLAPEGGQPLVGNVCTVRVTDEPALATLFRLQPWDDGTTRRPR
jgi:hypothetical protein